MYTSHPRLGTAEVCTILAFLHIPYVAIIAYIAVGHGTAGSAASAAISTPWLIFVKCFLMSLILLFTKAEFDGFP
jgi:hypothetical protein